MKIKIFRNSDVKTLEAAVNDFMSKVDVKQVLYHPEFVVTKYTDNTPRDMSCYDSVLITYEDK